MGGGQHRHQLYQRLLGLLVHSGELARYLRGTAELIPKDSELGSAALFAALHPDGNNEPFLVFGLIASNDREELAAARSVDDFPS